MKLNKALCRKVGIFNPHNYADGRAYLDYYPQELGRGGHPSTWRVVQKGKSFSDTWYDYGAKVFVVFGREEKQMKFEMALDWIYKTFGTIEMVKTPFGSYMEKSFVEKRNKEIQDAIKQGLDLREK